MKKKMFAKLLAGAMVLTLVAGTVPVGATTITNETATGSEGTLEIGEAVAMDVPEESKEANGSISDNELGVQLSEEAVYSYSGAKSIGKLGKASMAYKYQSVYKGNAGYSLYVSQPSVVNPFTLGQLTDTHLNAGLSSVNLMRNIAGLPDVSLDSGYNTKAQYGSVVMAANQKMTHYPGQPSTMPDDFYNEGKTACAQSNISYGWHSSNPSFYNLAKFTLGYMADYSSSNVQMVGHRRWILNPTMGKTGFGYANATNGAAYSAMYAFDKSATAPDYDFISWPASGNFPAELCETKYPWSVSLNPNVFNVSLLNTSSVTVKITEPNGNVIVLDSSKDTGSIPDDSQPYYTINKGGYGVANCIIFRPGSSSFSGSKLSGVYNVTITGLYDKKGAEATVSYDVDFFDALTYGGSDDSTSVSKYVDPASSHEQITAFVNRLYSMCLGRTADTDGLNTWVGKLENKQYSGADTAWGFFDSNELKNKNLSDEEYVDVLYRVLMGREADFDGKGTWVDLLQSGVSRKYVFKGFAESTEYTNICSEYGIVRGNVTLSQARDVNAGTTQFVARLYNKALGRSYDEYGLNVWTAKINSKSWSVFQVSTEGFFHSPEFLNKKTTNKEYIEILYRTFLGRDSDVSGFNFWNAKLSSGTSRDEVLRGFADSTEFKSIMAQYGL